MSVEDLEIPGLTIESLIGHGAHSTVYLARKGDGGTYAIKVANEKNADTREKRREYA